MSGRSDTEEGVFGSTPTQPNSIKQNVFFVHALQKGLHTGEQKKRKRKVEETDESHESRKTVRANSLNSLQTFFNTKLQEFGDFTTYNPSHYIFIRVSSETDARKGRG